MPSKYQKRHHEDIISSMLRKELEDTIGSPEANTVIRFIWKFNAVFAEDNSLFNQERFLKACGIGT